MKVLEHTNRIDYGRILMPDEGWQTSWAIGTTYSLDLEILMGIPLALFHGKYLSETTDLRNLRTDMLDALDKVRERLFVFVHENNISAKTAYSMLMSFLDQNIWNVNLESPNQNFHPKVWLVRYEGLLNPQEYRYKLIVMSRNMTAATDFDIAVSMDSYPTEREHEENASLIRMITSLMSQTKRNRIIKQLSHELKLIRFSAPYPFDSKPILFWPQAFNKKDVSPLLRNDNYLELMVISPFIDNATLEFLANKIAKGTKKKPILVSRENEMDALNPETLRKWDCYQWNSMLEEASDYEEYETDKPFEESYGRSISLHAKIFIAKAALGRDWNQWNNWFVGSTNSTQAGLRINYEAQVQLRSNHEETSPKRVLESLLNPDAPLISSYSIKDSVSINTEKELEKEFRKVVFDISHLSIDGGFVKNDQDMYVVHVIVDKRAWDTFRAKYPDVKVVFSPFSSNDDKWILDTNEYFFRPVYCQQLSTFVRVNITMNGTEKEFLLHLPFSVPEERNGKIMAEILDSEEKIMRYLMFCLDTRLDMELQKIGSEMKFSRQSVDSNGIQPYSLPIYERLMLAASRDKAALIHIKENVEKLKKINGRDGKRLLSKEFLEMWNKFSIYAK